jgi:hypothetical protein
MPALVRSRVGSPRGIKEELEITLCPLSSKKLKNAVRTSSPVIITYDFSLTYASCQCEEIKKTAHRQNSPLGLTERLLFAKLILKGSGADAVSISNFLGRI